MRGFWFLWSCSQFRIKSAHQGISAYLSSQLVSSAFGFQFKMWPTLQGECQRHPKASNGQTKPILQILLHLCWLCLDRILRPWLKSKEKETGWASGLSRQVGTDHGYQLTDNVSHIIMWHNIAIHTCIIENVLKMVRCVIVCLIYHSRNSIRISAVLQRNQFPQSRKVPCWALIVTWVLYMTSWPVLAWRVIFQRKHRSKRKQVKIC